jgi:citrate lyase subunit beta / citryl-CoA lyase
MEIINNEFVLRTMLFVPAHKKKLIENASKTKADSLVLDLEDSCLPIFEKPNGRKNIVESLKAGIFGKKKIFVRLNPRNTGFMWDDITTVTINELDGFLYPMAGSKDDIIFFNDLLDEIEMSKKIDIGKIKIFPVIETGEGIMNAFEIANASKRIVALGFGSEDFATDIQCIRDEDNESIFIARQRIVFAARSAGAIPIDTPHIKVHDTKGLEKHVSQARTLGFGGMQILHPKEIDICHKYYSYSKEEALECYKIIKLFQKAQNEGSGVAILDGRFISPPTYKRAVKIIENYELLNKFIKKEG